MGGSLIFERVNLLSKGAEDGFCLDIFGLLVVFNLFLVSSTGVFFLSAMSFLLI